MRFEVKKKPIGEKFDSKAPGGEVEKVFFRILADESPLGISLIGRDGRYKYINNHFNNIFGYTLDDIPTGEIWFEKAFPDPEYRQTVFSTWMVDLQNSRVGHSRLQIFKVVCKDGSEKIIKFRPVTLENSDQFVIYEEITEAKKFEEKLKDSEERFRMLFEYAPDAYYLNDLKGNFIDGNIAAEKMIGYRREELIRKNFLKLKLLPLKQIPKAAKNLAKHALGQPSGPDDFTLIRKDGSRIETEIRTYPVKIKGKSLVLGIARDITFRKQTEKKLQKAHDELEKRVEERTAELVVSNKQLEAEIEERTRTEEALRDSEEKYRLLAEHSADVIYKMNIENEQFTYTSPSTERLFGYTAEEGLSLKAQDIVTAESYAKQQASLIESLASGRQEQEILELEAVHKDGHTLPVEINANFILDEQGNPVEILGAVRDITERKRAEEELGRMAREWQTTFDTTNDAIWVLDKDARIQRANKKAEDLFHHIDKEMIGKQWWEIAHGTEQPIPDCPNQRARHSLCRETMEWQVGENWLKVTVDPILNKSGMYAGAVHIVTDITELKLSEEKLRKSEERFKFLAENMADIVWTLDMDLNATYVSPSIKKVLGFTPEERKRQKLEEMVTADSVERIIALFLEELQREEEQSSDPDRSKTIEVEYYHRDGSIVWMENLVKIQRNQKGKMVGVYGASRNITERKKAQEALRESEKKYQDLYDNAPDMFVSVDAKTGTITQYNQTLAKSLGYTKEEIIGRPVFDLYTSDSAEHAKSNVFPVFVKTGVVKEAELQLQRKDGSTIDVSLNVSAVRDKKGGILQSRSILRDITHRKRVEIALRQSEGKYRQLFNNAPAGIYEVDFIKGKFITVNEVMCAYSGYTKEELLAMSPFDLLTENSKKRFSKRLEKILAGEKMPSSVEYDIIAKNGQKLSLILNTDFVYKDGKLEGARVVVHDITKRKRLEEELRHVRKMEAIGTLAGGIAHQFNNALYVNTLNIELLEMNFPGHEKVTKYAKRMTASAQRMTQLTAQLLAYARGGKYLPTTVSLSDFVKETLPMVKHTIDAAIHVDTKLSRDILNVKADLVQMQMVLSAVLTNASETMAGKGRIRVTCRNETITDKAAEDFPGLRPGNYAILTIEDDGMGMDEETKSRIFEPFFTTKFAGRGLGMAAAYGIVKNHDGWISVDSKLDKGTIVKIYLPAVETPVKEDVKKSPRRDEWVKGTGTILVIDDEEAIMAVTKPILERMGYSVLEARTGQEALDVVKTFNGDIDLAMLDVLMPGMSGETIYPLLMKARPELKVLVFSGYSIDGPVQKILDAGAEDFIQKPFTMADLSEKLKKLLGGEQ